MAKIQREESLRGRKGEPDDDDKEERMGEWGSLKRVRIEEHGEIDLVRGQLDGRSCGWKDRTVKTGSRPVCVKVIRRSRAEWQQWTLGNISFGFQH